MALAIAGLSCGERITAPQGQQNVSFAVAPAFTPRAALIEDALATFGLTVDTIRIRLTRAGGEVALDTLIEFPAAVDSIAITLSLPISGNTEALTALIELRQGSTVLFSGTQGITLRVNPPSGGNAPEIPIEYVGPGAEAETVVLEPADTTVQPGATFQLRVAALDALGDTVPESPIDWRSLDPTIGTVDTLGNFSAVATRGLARIAAKLPNLVEDTAFVRIVPPATHLAVISGDGQTGPAGAALAAPIVVQVQAADNLPVPGVTVNFAVETGGGSVAPPSAVGDTLGRVNATFTLGTGVGVQSIRATSAGLPDLVISATSVAAAATQIVILDQPQDSATVGVGLDVAPRVELRDVFGNPRLVAGTNVSVALTAPAVGSIGGTTTVATDGNGRATFNGLQLNALIGPVTLTFTAGALPAVVSDTVVLVRGPAAVLAVEGGTAFSAVAGDSLPLVHAIRVTDAGGNGVDSVAVTASKAPEPDTTFFTDSTGRVRLRRLGVPQDAGVHPFTFTSAGLTGSPATVTITVTAGSPTSLAFTQTPSDTAVVGNALVQQPRVQLKDAFGNPVLSAGVNVTAQMVGGTNALTGTTTIPTNTSGIAIFTNLAITGASGNVQMRFVAAGLDTLVSDTIVVFPALATKLDFTLEPASPMANTPFNVIVTATDDFGNTDVGFTGNVTVAIGANPSGSTLGGTLTQAAVNGLATFGNLTLNNTGTGYTLVATGAGLAPDTTAAFEVITGVTYHDVRRPGDIAIYKNIAPWFGENKDETVLQGNPFKLAPGIGDYTVHPMADLLSGVPPTTSIVILTSASDGDAGGQIDEQQAGFSNLDTWVRNGGWLVVHAGDNYAPDGYQVPGLTGIVDADTACTGLTPAVADHAFIRGPDALLGTADDIVPFIMGVCSDNHGSLEGILPGNAEVLLREDGDLMRAVYATYTLGAGRVIVTTQSIEFVSHSTQALINHFYWALNGVNAGPAQPVVRNVNWLGGTGFWNDPLKWDIGMVPAVDDTVRIGGTGFDTVFVNSTVTAQTIIVGGASGQQTLVVGSNLTITDRLVVNTTGSLFVDDVTIAGNGAIDIHGTMTVDYGLLHTVGALTLSPSSTTSIAGQVWRRFGPLLFNGPATVQDGASFFFGDGAVATIGASSTLNLVGAAGQIGVGTGGASLINNGTITRSGGTGIFSIAVPSSNNSTVNVSSGILRIDATGSHTHSGTWNLSSGTQLEWANGTYTVNGDVLGTGSMRNVNANPTLNGNVAVRRLTNSNGTMSLTGSLTVSDTVLVSNGTLNLNTGGVVGVPRFQLDAGTLGGTDTLVVTDSLIWSNGTMTGAGRTTLAAGAGARATTASTKAVSAGRNVQVAGTWRWDAGPMTIGTGASLTVLPTGVFDIVGDQTVSSSGSMLNQGIVRKSAGATVSGIGVAFVNEGLTEVLSGTLRINALGTYVHPGPFATQAGSTLEFQAGTVTLDSTISGTGVTHFSGASLTANAPIGSAGVRLSFGTVTLTAPLVGVDSLSITNGTLNLNSLGTMSVGQFSQTAGTLQGVDTLIVTDSLRWNGGNQGGTGVTRIDSGAVAIWDVTTRGLLGGRRLEVGGLLLWNTGATTLSNGSTVQIDSGAVMNIAGAHSLSSGTGGGFLQNNGALLRTGAVGVATIATGFGSTGVVDIQAGSLRLSNTGGPFTTSGLVSVAANALFEFNLGTHLADAMFAGSGAVSQTGGTVTLSGTFLASQLSLSSGTLNLSSGAPVTVARFLHNSGNVQGGDTLVVTDSLFWMGGNAQGTGRTVLGSSAVAYLPTGGSRNLLGGRTMLIEGYVINDASGTTFGGGSTLTVAPGGNFEIRGDLSFGTTTGGGSFINNGTVSRTTTVGTTAFNMPFFNNANVSITSGTLRLNAPAGTYAHSGAFVVTAPGILDITGSGTHNFLGSVTGTGSASFSGSTVNNVTNTFFLPSLTVSAGTLDFTGNVLFEIPRITLAGGIIQGTDTIVVSDSMTWTGGTMTGLGTLRVADSASLVLATTGSRSLLGARRIEVFGALVGQAGSLSFGGGSTMITDTASASSITGAISINTTTGSGTWTHRGALAREMAVGTATVSVPFVNEGTVDVTLGSLVLSATGVFAHTGDFTVNTPGALTLTTGTHNVSGTVGGTGTVTVSAGTTNFSNAFSLPVFNSTGGATNFTGGVSGLDSLKVPGGTVAFASGASVTVPKFLLTGGIVQGLDTLVVTDTLEWSSGTMSGTGRTVVSAGVGAHFSTTSTKSLQGGRAFVVEGTAHWSGGTIALTSSPLTVAPTGQFTIAAVATMSGASGATFVNGGLLRRTTTGTATITSPFVNNGTVDVTSGLLSIANPAGTHTHTGPFVVTAPGTLEFAGAGTQVVDSSITGTGFGRVSATSLTVNGTYALPSLVASGGAATFAGALGPLDSLRNSSGTLALNTGDVATIDRVFLVSGTLQGSDSIVVVDSMDWAAGTMTGTAATRIVDSAVVNLPTTGTKILSGGRSLLIDGDARWGGGGWQLGNGSQVVIAATGDLEVTSNVTMTATTGGGLLVNNGSIRRTAGTGGFSVATRFQNHGVVETFTGQSFFTPPDTVVHTGRWHPQGSTMLTVGGHTQTFDGPFVGSGRITISGTVSTFNDTLDVGTVLMANGRATVNGPVMPLDSLQVNGGDSISFATGAPVVTDVYVQVAGRRIGADTIVVVDTLLWQGGTMGGAGVTHALSSATTTLSSGTKTLAETHKLLLEGPSTWSAGAVTALNTSMLHVGVGGTLNATTTLTMNGPGYFANEGTVTKSGTGTLTFNAGVANQGLLSVTSGAVTIGATTGTFVHLGQFDVADGTSLTFSGTSVQNTLDPASSVTGAGAINFAGGTTIVNGSLTARRTNFTLGSLTIGGSFNVSDSAIFNVAASPINLNSNVTIPVGSRWYIHSSGGINGSGTLTVDGELMKRNNSSAVSVNVPVTVNGSLGSINNVFNFTRGFNLATSGTIFGGSAVATNAVTVIPDSVGVWDGALAPGNFAGPGAGQLTLNGAVVGSPTAEIRLEIGGTTARTGYDVLVLGSQASFTGPINVSLINSFVPTTGNTFTIMTYPAGTTPPVCATQFTLPAGITCSNVTITTTQVSILWP